MFFRKLCGETRAKDFFQKKIGHETCNRSEVLNHSNVPIVVHVSVFIIQEQQIMLHLWNSNCSPMRFRVCVVPIPSARITRGNCSAQNISCHQHERTEFPTLCVPSNYFAFVLSFRRLFPLGVGLAGCPVGIICIDFYCRGGLRGMFTIR